MELTQCTASHKGLLYHNRLWRNLYLQNHEVYTAYKLSFWPWPLSSVSSMKPTQALIWEVWVTSWCCLTAAEHRWGVRSYQKWSGPVISVWTICWMMSTSRVSLLTSSGMPVWWLARNFHTMLPLITANTLSQSCAMASQSHDRWCTV